MCARREIGTDVRLVNTKAHVLVDYIIGIVLLTSGWTFGFHGSAPAEPVAMFAGCLMILVAALTKFEFGLFRILPLRAHLGIDLVTGILLATSPWALGFDSLVYKPHFVFGLTQVIISVLTDRMLYSQYRERER